MELSVSKKIYRLAGGIFGTDASILVESLSSEGWRVRQPRSDEIELSSRELDVAIYMDKPVGENRYDFLVSGELEGAFDEVRALLEQIGHLLTAHDIVYDFEFSDADDPEKEYVVRPSDM